MKQQAIAQVTASMEKEYKEKIEAEAKKVEDAQAELKKRAQIAETEMKAAVARAQALEKQLQLSASEESTAFALHFDLLQQSIEKMQTLAKELDAKGQEEQAKKLRGALKNALMSIAKEVAV